MYWNPKILDSDISHIHELEESHSIQLLVSSNIPITWAPNKNAFLLPLFKILIEKNESYLNFFVFLFVFEKGSLLSVCPGILCIFVDQAGLELKAVLPLPQSPESLLWISYCMGYCILYTQENRLTFCNVFSIWLVISRILESQCLMISVLMS